MNTNALKKFAQEARRKLMVLISARLEFVLSTDSSFIREKADQVEKLKEAIKSSSKEQIVEKVTYTWFNRFMALRFMDVNDYQPIEIRVLTPKDNFTLPAILEEAKQGNIPDELKVDKQRIFDLLDGKIPSTNGQNEAYKELLIGACNHLNSVFPFLFERINDYTELLLPDDLTSELSIIQDIRDGMGADDCSEVEVIGWLYQFFISEKKDEVFASKSAVKKEDIPAATQLFTPRWIVEYMVQNTVGKLWLQNRPNSKLRDFMPYFIESPSVTSDDYLKIQTVEEITLLDQACGSGHILVYGFELLTKIYEEEGYNATEIPQLILERNLFGFEIDERASQLASFALMMKARSYNRRFFRKEVQPTILCYKDLKLSEEEIEQAFTQIGFEISDEVKHDLLTMQQATNYGSLIIPHTDKKDLLNLQDKINTKVNTGDAFLKYQLEQLTLSLEQLFLLSDKYHCIVDNPPYMGGNMNKELSNYVSMNYPDSKSDLMACFIEAGVSMLQPKGFLGMINQHSWMFLSSYEKLREKLTENIFFDTNLHLGSRTFPEIGGEVVQNTSFTFWNKNLESKGIYLRLVDFNSTELKRENVIQALKNPKCNYYYIANQKDFKKIPGSPIGYWLNQNWKSLFNISTVGKKAISDGQNITGNNERYLRLYWEVDLREISKNSKWPLTAKGGSFRRWSGNICDVVSWSPKSIEEYKNNKIARIQSEKLWFRKGITWNLISSTGTGFRILYDYQLFNKAAPTILFEKEDEKFINGLLGFLNTKISTEILKILNPTFNTNIKEVLSIPYEYNINNEIDIIVEDCIKISDSDWNKSENSSSFLKNEIIRIKGQDLEESYDLFQVYWKNKFYQLHKNEEELNRQFIDIYGLQEELKPEVPFEDVTILKEETMIVNGQLVFKSDEIFKQFMSYAVGCMFGRFSLDIDGFIIANQGETLEDYIEKVYNGQEVQTEKFLPDVDNILPILDDEWFEDDVVGRFYAFLKASFGKENFDKNLAFVEECLGKDIRKYFVKDFYTDHIKRYKKRPIYWMFSSPKGAFNVLVYMHRYTPDTLNKILNNYLVEYKEKLSVHMEYLDNLIVSGSSIEQSKAQKEKDKLKLVLVELNEYERDVLRPLALERIAIDLDDGVLVNYNKFGKVIKEVSGLNDTKTKKKVKEFDWIDVTQIR
jgi:type II restriction/modification system DNA methylase subunit YeeA